MMKRFLVFGTLVVFVSLLCLGLLPNSVSARPSLEITKTLLTSPPIAVGDDVVFEITVTNTGDVDLVNVEVTDGAVQDCYRFIGALAVGDNVTYNCTAHAVTRDFLNLAIVRGGTFDDEDCYTVRAAAISDRIDVDVLTPAIDIRKQAKGIDSRTFPCGPSSPLDVQFEIEVCNTGEVDLMDVQVTDFRVPDCERTFVSLPVGSCEIYTCTAVGVEASFRNVATVTADTGVCPSVVRRSDISDVVCEGPPECDLEITKTADPDVIFPGPTPNCDTIDGKPDSLTFKYTGGGCAASSNSQDPGKTDCSGSINPALAVQVAAGDEGDLDPAYNVVPSTVNPGEEFVVSPLSGNDFKSNSTITLTNAGGTEIIDLHTSCSQPLEIGDVFGSLTLVEINGEGATDTEVTYTYVVTNNGSPVTNVTVEDDQLGQIAGPFSLATGETRTFTEVAEILTTTTNIATVTGFLTDGTVCEDQDTATVTVLPPPEPFVCQDAKPIDSLTMIWNGSGTVTVTTPGTPASFTINPNEEITVSNLSGLGNDIEWTISGADNGTSTFHVSCSDPDMNGPEDCGKPQGDGKDKAGFLNLWIFEGMAGQLTLDCNP